MGYGGHHPRPCETVPSRSAGRRSPSSATGARGAPQPLAFASLPLGASWPVGAVSYAQRFGRFTMGTKATAPCSSITTSPSSLR